MEKLQFSFKRAVKLFFEISHTLRLLFCLLITTFSFHSNSWIILLSDSYQTEMNLLIRHEKLNFSVLWKYENLIIKIYVFTLTTLLIITWRWTIESRKTMNNWFIYDISNNASIFCWISFFTAKFHKEKELLQPTVCKTENSIMKKLLNCSLQMNFKK